MNELQDYLQSMLAHLDDMAKRTIFMMGVQYGKRKKSSTTIFTIEYGTTILSTENCNRGD